MISGQPKDARQESIDHSLGFRIQSAQRESAQPATVDETRMVDKRGRISIETSLRSSQSNMHGGLRLGSRQWNDRYQ
jgi:hypothetical protein